MLKFIPFGVYIQLALDIGGSTEIPVVSQLADFSSGTISLFRGNWGDAGLSYGGILIPGLSQAKLAKYGLKYADEIVDVGITVRKTTNKIPLPTIKSSKFGPKIADAVPTNGVPKNWSKEQIGDAITDYQISIMSRKKELAHFIKNNKGDAIGHKLHAQRITQEENFLKSLQKAFQ